MTRSPDSTLPASRVPTLVLIAPTPELFAACDAVARGLPDAPALKIADVAGAASIVAEWRPFAVIIPATVFAFDPDEFRALAGAVGAELLPVATEDSKEAIEARLAPRLGEVLAWWQAKEVVSP